MARFSPINRGGNVPAAGKAGGPAVGTWLGKLGQAALGTGRFKLQMMMANQRFQQRQELFKQANDEWDRRRGVEKKDQDDFIEKALTTKGENPGLTSISGDKLTFSGREVAMPETPTGTPGKSKNSSKGKPRLAQGPTRDIIALRKAHEVGDGKVMSHRQAMGHRGYRTAFQAHIKAGGTEQNFLDNYTPLGYKSRRQNPGENRNDNFGGGNN